MHFAFGVFAGVFLQVHRRIALLRACPFVVGKPFIARQLPIYFFKLHQTAPTGLGIAKCPDIFRFYYNSESVAISTTVSNRKVSTCIRSEILSIERVIEPRIPY